MDADQHKITCEFVERNSLPTDVNTLSLNQLAEVRVFY